MMPQRAEASFMCAITALQSQGEPRANGHEEEDFSPPLETILCLV